MKKIFFLLLVLLSTINSPAQNVKGELKARQIFYLKNALVVTGHIEAGNTTVFKATSYDKDLNVINEYEKKINEESKWCYATMYGEIMVVYIKTKTKKVYWLKLDEQLKEISFNEENDSNKETTKNEKKLPAYQPEIEGSAIGLSMGAVLPSMVPNKRFLKNDIIDFDRKTKTISRNKLVDSKLEPAYTSVWSTPLKSIGDIKLIEFSYVDEDIIIGHFIFKEEKKWKRYLCQLEAKTGNIKFIIPVSLFTDTPFFIQNTYFDKQNGNIIIAGSICSEMAEKCTEMAIVSIDNHGKMVNTQTISLPDYDVKEPANFNFKNKKFRIEHIDKLPNGNYFFNVTNATRFNSGASENRQYTYLIMGFSYYEIGTKLNIISSNFKIAENFNKKFDDKLQGPAIIYNGESKDGQFIFFTETIKKSKAIKMMDITSKENTTKELIFIDDFREMTATFTFEDDIDKLETYFLDNYLILLRKFQRSYKFEMTIIPIK